MPVIECERHHLRYDSDRQPGCVICLREAGAPRGGASAKIASPAEARATGLILPLVAAMAIWALSALGLVTAHQAVLDLVAAHTAAEETARNAALAAQKAEAAQREQQSLQLQEPAPAVYEPTGVVDAAPAESGEPQADAEPAADVAGEPSADASEPPPQP